MLSRVIPVLTAVLLLGQARAGECDEPARKAELALEIPADLLAAIGRVESGRRGVGGGIAAWPWSINAAGQGYFLQSSAEAVAVVASLQARGVQSIDVGCFQVNLLYHPGAFASLAEAFDPAANAMAAGRFLRDLRDAATGWEAAVARYHSANPGLGQPYMQQVMASWAGGPAMIAPPLSQVAALVRVIVPSSFSVLALGRDTLAKPPRIVWSIGPRFGGLRLPVVITPSHPAL